MDSGSGGRLIEVADFVRSYLERTAPSEQQYRYRWEHTLRVTSYGRQIAEAEGADVELSIASCLLHDVAKFESAVNADHGRLSAEVSRPVLLEIGFSPAETGIICHAVAVHVDGEAGDEHPETVESRVVTDADNVDRFGAHRIIMWCLPHMDDFPTLLEVLRSRLVTLEKYRERDDMLETEAGNRLFLRQLDRQIAFFRALLAEGDLTRLPVDG